jgi:hypothetical protein
VFGHLVRRASRDPEQPGNILSRSPRSIPCPRRDR